MLAFDSKSEIDSISGRRITHLQVATAEDALVQNQSLSNETGLGELDIGVTVKHSLSDSASSYVS
jgi:hypothetical protein